MMKILLSALALLGAALVPTGAEAAANGYTTGDVNMRAGPGTEYPRVFVLPYRTPVTIYGCLRNYGWCDVGAYRERGWVSSRYLSIFYADNSYVPYRPAIQPPIISFSFGYWDDWYSDRPWYHTQRPHRPIFNDDGPAPFNGRLPNDDTSVRPHNNNNNFVVQEPGYNDNSVAPRKPRRHQNNDGPSIFNNDGPAIISNEGGGGKKPKHKRCGGGPLNPDGSCRIVNPGTSNKTGGDFND